MVVLVFTIKLNKLIIHEFDNYQVRQKIGNRLPQLCRIVCYRKTVIRGIAELGSSNNMSILHAVHLIFFSIKTMNKMALKVTQVEHM